MKKLFVVFLVFLGLAFGYWLALENKRLLELPVHEEGLQESAQRRRVDMEKIAVGMDIWQVKEILGIPEDRRVLPATGDTRKEEWRYGPGLFCFNNGILTSWRMNPEKGSEYEAREKP